VSFDILDDKTKFVVMDCLLEGLITANVAYLIARPGTPMLYASGVHYLGEPDGRDEWQDIPDTIARGHGDCEDLACWRIAELRVRGGERNAVPNITVDLLPDSKGRQIVTYHIRVKHQDGQIEDPSRVLGMP
jgi:hypothetical protein